MPGQNQRLTLTSFSFCIALEMKMNWLWYVCGLLCLAALNGCVSTPDGGQTMAFSPLKDKIESRYKRGAKDVWAAAKDVIRYNGTLVGEDVLQSTLRGDVNERKVWIKAEELDDQVTKVIVQVRTRSGGTDMDLAAELDKQIAIRLATGNLSPGTTAYPTPAGK
jgi:hypothetical protein